MNINMTRLCQEYKPRFDSAVAYLSTISGKLKNSTQTLADSVANDYLYPAARTAQNDYLYPAIHTVKDTICQNPGTTAALGFAGATLYSAYRDIKAIGRAPTLTIKMELPTKDGEMMKEPSIEISPSMLDKTVLLGKALGKVAVAACTVALCTEAGRNALGAAASTLATKAGVDPVETARKFTDFYNQAVVVASQGAASQADLGVDSIQQVNRPSARPSSVPAVSIVAMSLASAPSQIVVAMPQESGADMQINPS